MLACQKKGGRILKYLLMLMAIFVASASADEDPESWGKIDRIFSNAVSSDDKPQLAYIAARCSGNLFAFAKSFDTKSNSDVIQKQFLDSASLLMSAYASLQENLGGYGVEGQQERLDAYGDQIRDFAKAYIDRMELNLQTKGSYVADDPFMKDEVNFCSELANSLSS